MALIKGKNCVLFIYESGQWMPFACSTSISLNVETDFLETSGLNSGKNKEYMPVSNGFTCEASGLVKLSPSSQLSLAELRAKQLSHTKIKCTYERVDIDNNVYSDLFFGYISSTNDEASFDGLNTFSITIKGTGELIQSFIPVQQGGGKVNRLQFTLTEGITSVIKTELINKDVLEVVRDGIGNSKLITSGSPASKECKYTSASGTLEWAIEAADGEECYVLYQNL